MKHLKECNQISFTSCHNKNMMTIIVVVDGVSSSHQSPRLCFAVSVGKVHSDSTVNVVGFEGQSKRWRVS